MIKNEVIHKIIKGMVTYLSTYQLKKLKTILQEQLEDVEVNFILTKDKLNKERSSNTNYLKMFISTKEIFTYENIKKDSKNYSVNLKITKNSKSAWQIQKNSVKYISITKRKGCL